MAEKCNFVMDPGGDVLLTLSNPDAPFAVWEDSGGVRQLETVKQLEAPEDGPAPGPAPEMTFLLSSRHLSLASPVFETMLSGKWSEGLKVDSDLDSLYRVTAEDFDSEALAMVMNVIHGRWSLVPRTVSLEMLARIAVIVDYYDIREALQLILSLWMQNLPVSSVPTSLSREGVLWILVSWVFKNNALFRQATKVAILRSRHDLELPGDIPIPSSIIKEINTRRRDSINEIAESLKELGQGYTVGRYGCDFECSSMHLGALMKGLNSLKFDLPAAPFEGLSLVEVVDGLQGIKSPTWAKETGRCCRTLGGYLYGNERCNNCPKAHKCSQNILALEFHLGVGGSAVTTLSQGALGHHAASLVRKLESNLVIDLH